MKIIVNKNNYTFILDELRHKSQYLQNPKTYLNFVTHIYLLIDNSINNSELEIKQESNEIIVNIYTDKYNDDGYFENFAQVTEGNSSEDLQIKTKRAIIDGNGKGDFYQFCRILKRFNVMIKKDFVKTSIIWLT